MKQNQNTTSKGKKENNYEIADISNYELEVKLTALCKHSFIETPFAERFQGFINDAKLRKKWAIVGAYSRNGKSWCIKDLVRNSGAVKEYGGKTIIPVLAIRSPESSTPTDIIESLCSCIGNLPHMNTSSKKKWLVENIPNFGVEQIIIDDAHELNLNHFKFIKWFTDTLELEKNYYVSIVLSSIISANMITALQKIQQYSNEAWMQQFYERFSLFREVQGHTPEEVGQILYGFEELYRPYLPEINLIQYTGNIFGWLTNPKLDIPQCRRVAMEHLSKLIHESARIACIKCKMQAIPGDLLFHVYNTYLLNRDRLYSTEDEPIYKPSNLNLKKDII